MQAIVSVVNIFLKIELMRYSVGERLFLDVDGSRCVRVRGQRGLEEFCQWPLLRNGVNCL